MTQELTIVDVEPVADSFIGVRLSNDTVLLISLAELLLLGAPAYILLNDDEDTNPN